ncbi:hypothetical protein PAF15_02000 [Weissella koreensis]|uniref:Uncharacterized protein n=1 Tax=Weissella koreensis TaxID=165096 RepID=A0A7H1MKV4_9LACO|nr:hypothetical protein [Weissella koreensis]AEJ23245.1 hypothetical protein WKK_01845 [Weissella koreensis KACC 15510]AVH74888.1 hypothetical protein C4597_02115 [Weissella koreensis]EJF33848.1 hypothetical protein JC2156_06620 [Weissella koreensis KCTC 3621]MCZ9310750.1 hypothetical protein [Weissella koreensis]QGN20111.1 hypothetical protein GKC51_02090 [Weissella koreensis]
MSGEMEKITASTFIDLINQLGFKSPIVGEKTMHTEPGFKVRDPKQQVEYQLPYWDILRRADESYWSPLDGDRKTVYNVTDFEILINENWIPIIEWYMQDTDTEN